MNPDNLLEEIKSRTDIVEFISDYVPLKKAGQNYKGLCPFHSEKTPSFMVSQSKQIFHCFGCGVGGDVVTFLMKQENLSFSEAIRYLAKKTGIRIAVSKRESERSVKREQILRVNEEAMNFYKKTLHDSKAAMDYLKNRGISNESIRSFALGYAGGNRDNLYAHLKKNGYSDLQLTGAGIAVAEGKGYRDWFRNRIIFPIMNMKNDVIAFGGRVMDSSLPKYINTPETDVFKKSDALFAINFSRDEIRKKDYAIIVEGYLDTIICHQHGFRNTVAPLGTALTSRHLQKLKVLSRRAVLVFDSDQAGIAAARRSLLVLCENDFRAKVLLLPENEDPDSFLRENGSQPFKKMLSEAASMVVFLMNTSKDERSDTVREALRMISAVKDLILADEMLSELSDCAGIHETVLREELEKIRKRPGLKAADKESPGHAVSHREEYILLSTVIAFPEKAEYILSKLDTETLKEESVRAVFGKIRSLAENLTVDRLLATADENERSLITELSLNPGFDQEHVDRNIDDCLQTIQQRRLEAKRRSAEKSGDVALLDSLLKEKQKFLKRAHP